MGNVGTWVLVSLLVLMSGLKLIGEENPMKRLEAEPEIVYVDVIILARGYRIVDERRKSSIIWNIAKAGDIEPDRLPNLTEFDLGQITVKLFTPNEGMVYTFSVNSMGYIRGEDKVLRRFPFALVLVDWVDQWVDRKMDRIPEEIHPYPGQAP